MESYQKRKYDQHNFDGIGAAFVTTNTPFLTLRHDTKRGHLLALMVLMIAHHLSHLDLLDHGKLYNKYLH